MEILSQEMDKVAVRIPKTTATVATSHKINAARLEYEMIGRVWKSKGTNWTILYDNTREIGPVLKPTYSRVITVRVVDDIFDTVKFANSDIQTIGLAASSQRKIQYAEQVARQGVARLPDIGRMTNFDMPWDGFNFIEKVIRWVTLGGPV